MKYKLTIHGKSECISFANWWMQQAFHWYAVGDEAQGDEYAKRAEKCFEAARRTHHGAYVKIS